MNRNLFDSLIVLFEQFIRVLLGSNYFLLILQQFLLVADLVLGEIENFTLFRFDISVFLFKLSFQLISFLYQRKNIG